MAHPERNQEVLENPTTFKGMLERRWQADHFVCVGLDSQYDKIPECVRSGVSVEEAMFKFNREIVDATHELVCAYKPNLAFYEAEGPQGSSALIRTVEYIHESYPGIPVILDAKKGDIGSTSEAYAKSVFDVIGADAVTVFPHLGQEALEPFLSRTDRGIIVVCRTSNPGAPEMQDWTVKHVLLGVVPYFQIVAFQVANYWNGNDNCGLVVGATYPGELAAVRKMAPSLPFLLPGVGIQGAKVEDVVKAGKNEQNAGMIINSSRGIIFASSGGDFAEAAKAKTESLRNQINLYR